MVQNTNGGLYPFAQQAATTYGFGGVTYGGSHNVIENKITEPVVRTIKPAKRCIERLREEITDWHGSILK